MSWAKDLIFFDVNKGFYKSKEQLEWILKNSVYNFRAGLDRGSLTLGLKEVSADFLILHGPNESITNKIFRLSGKGPKVWSKQNLIAKNYPTEPKGDFYMVYEIIEDSSISFNHLKVDLKRLQDFKNFRQSPKPISITLTEIFKAKSVELEVNTR